MCSLLKSSITCFYQKPCFCQYFIKENQEMLMENVKTPGNGWRHRGEILYQTTNYQLLLHKQIKYRYCLLLSCLCEFIRMLILQAEKHHMLWKIPFTNMQMCICTVLIKTQISLFTSALNVDFSYCKFTRYFIPTVSFPELTARV